MVSIFGKMMTFKKKKNYNKQSVTRDRKKEKKQVNLKKQG